MLRRDFFTSLTLLGAAFGINKLPLPEGDKHTEKTSVASLNAQPKLQVQMSTPESTQALLLQTCAVAGFQYHEGEAVWNELSPTQSLALVREPNNVHDDRAVRIEWCGRQIGYIPRRENAVVAGLLDRGERLTAKVAQVQQSDDPWQRVALDIWVRA